MKNDRTFRTFSLKFFHIIELIGVLLELLTKYYINDDKNVTIFYHFSFKTHQ